MLDQVVAHTVTEGHCCMDGQRKLGMKMIAGKLNCGTRSEYTNGFKMLLFRGCSVASSANEDTGGSCIAILF